MNTKEELLREKIGIKINDIANKGCVYGSLKISLEDCFKLAVQILSLPELLALTTKPETEPTCVNLDYNCTLPKFIEQIGIKLWQGMCMMKYAEFKLPQKEKVECECKEPRPYDGNCVNCMKPLPQRPGEIEDDDELVVKIPPISTMQYVMIPKENYEKLKEAVKFISAEKNKS